MQLPRVISWSVCVASFALFAGCSKETGTSGATPASTPPASVPAEPAQSAPATSSSSGPASGGNDGEMLSLANKSGCLACHSVDKKIVGPEWKGVANKYRWQADAEAKLAQKVKKGGQSVWGNTPMPPNFQVSDEDINKLVRWILTLK